MLIKGETGIVCNSDPVQIGARFIPNHALYYVDGVYWERLPTFDYYEQKLQKALLTKSTLPIYAVYEMTLRVSERN